VPAECLPVQQYMIRLGGIVYRSAATLQPLYHIDNNINNNIYLGNEIQNNSKLSLRDTCRPTFYLFQYYNDIIMTGY